MNQIALPFDIDGEAEDSDYIITEANKWVHEQLQNWQLWPHYTGILVGPEGAGKTAMAAQFLAHSGGSIEDDAAQCADDALFHRWNIANEEKTPLLLVSRQPVAEWGIKLPDLKSRLAASHMMELGAPDQPMIEGLLQKYFVRRGMSISEDAIRFLGKRMERSYPNIQLLARNMDQLASARKKPITLAIARSALMQLQDIDDNVSTEADDMTGAK
ncbi:hypothetical protein [Parasphingorhabdus sp.]|uniref:hypothetical protein n=1 Tax=Parasphingorhabdus sp. TaxID=2709688 RepID=UPI003D281FE9